MIVIQVEPVGIGIELEMASVRASRGNTASISTS
jgi:hypothetical protein